MGATLYRVAHAGLRPAKIFLKGLIMTPDENLLLEAILKELKSINRKLYFIKSRLDLISCLLTAVLIVLVCWWN